MLLVNEVLQLLSILELFFSVILSQIKFVHAISLFWRIKMMIKKEALAITVKRIKLY